MNIQNEFRLQFDTDNAAFMPDDMIESARILRTIADAMDKHGRDHGNCVDSNGNKVGRWYLTKDVDEPEYRQPAIPVLNLTDEDKYEMEFPGDGQGGD